MKFRCHNCKEKFENKECLIKVKQAGKERLMCDACYAGYLLVKEEKKQLETFARKYILNETTHSSRKS